VPSVAPVIVPQQVPVGVPAAGARRGSFFEAVINLIDYLFRCIFRCVDREVTVIQEENDHLFASVFGHSGGSGGLLLEHLSKLNPQTQEELVVEQLFMQTAGFLARVAQQFFAATNVQISDKLASRNIDDVTNLVQNEFQDEANWSAFLEAVRNASN